MTPSRPSDVVWPLRLYRVRVSITAVAARLSPAKLIWVTYEVHILSRPRVLLFNEPASSQDVPVSKLAEQVETAFTGRFHQGL